MTHTSPAIVHVNDLSFEAEVLREARPVLVDFSATWCGPCKVLAPLLEQLAVDRPDVKVVVVDIDESPETAVRHGVRAAPTLLIFVAGEKRARHVGLTSKARIVALLASSTSPELPPVL